MDEETITEYDEDGNPTYFRDSNGFEWRREYNKYGYVIRFDNLTSGFWRRQEYDEFGHPSYMCDSTGLEVWTEFDEIGQWISYRNSRDVRICTPNPFIDGCVTEE